MIPVLKPGLDVKMNIPKRQEYCAKKGVPFVPLLPNEGAPIAQQPTYNPNMGSSSEASAPPPPYMAQDPLGAGGGFYPPNARRAPTSGTPYILPGQQEQPRQYIVDTGYRHHHHHGSISMGSNSS